MTTPAKPTQFEMKFDPMTIEHFGLRLYSHLPPVLNELVSNAYDADSSKVEVTVPSGPITPASEVIVRDFGHGMNAREVQEEYLVIGRPRRGKDSTVTKSKSGARSVTGRKGLGKLSVFGVADEMELRSVQSGQAICLKFSFPAMRAWAEANGNTQYQPEVVAARSGVTKEPTGVEVRLRRLRRTTPIDADDVRKGLAKRLTICSAAFEVKVNGTAIGPGDRLSKNDCAEGQCWDVTGLPPELAIGDGLSVTGWIGFLEESSQRHRGVDIFATGKAVELGSYFNLSTTHAQFARAYLVGEVHADFLDAGQDLVSTARNSVVWETPQAIALQQWGQKVLTHLFDQWVTLRRTKKEEDVIKTAKFDVWLKTRTPGEQRTAKRIVRVLVDDDSMDPASLVPLLEIVKGSVESVAFHELIDKIEEGGSSIKTLLELFEEWRVIEAREHLRLADGRLEALKQLEAYAKRGAREVQEVQPLLEKHLWMLDPTWTEASGQTRYTDILRKQFAEDANVPDDDKRLDIMGISAGGILTVVEFKRPQATLSRKHLTQIDEYVEWMNDNYRGSGPDAPVAVHGLLVVGKLQASLGQAISKRIGAGIRVETFNDLIQRCKAQLGHTDKILRNTAPEYSSQARKARKASSNPVVLGAAKTAPAAFAKNRKKSKKRKKKRR